ncbi:hypothetical protein Tco_0995993 [Tanacetum coccineum]
MSLKQPSVSSKEAKKASSEAGANPQLSSGMSPFNLNEPIYSAYFIIHSESASGNDALTASTINVFIHTLMNEGTKITSYDHSFSGKVANSIARQVEEEEAFNTIKGSSAKGCVKEVDDEVHAIEDVETEDTSVPKSSSPRSSQIQELTKPTKPKTLQWELPAEFLPLPSQVEMVQAKLKTLDALPSLLSKVINALNQFAQAITLRKTGSESVPLAGQAGTQLAEG